MESKKLTIEVTRFELTDKLSKFWDVGFTITTENGHTYYTPTTVHAYDLRGNESEYNIIRFAADKLLATQIAHALTDAKPPTLDYFDTMEPSDGGC